MTDSENTQIPTVSLGKISLLGEQTPISCCGAAFTLVTPAEADVILPLGESAQIEIRQGQRDVVVRFQGVKNASEAFHNGHVLAQQGLDLFSILGKLDTIIQDAEEDHVLWWTETAGLVVRVVSTVTMPMSVGEANLQAIDSEGNVIPPPPSEHPQHHFGFRYYRLAQASDDLYDAYRNMYLAFEALLSSQYPKLKKGQPNRKRDEGEKEWLERGLKAVNDSLSLNNLVPNESDPVKIILHIIYNDARLPLFHAKSDEKVYTPHDSPAHRKVVSKALNILTQIVLRMAEVWFNSRRLGGRVYFDWFYKMLSDQLADSKMLVFDDSAIDPNVKNVDQPRNENALHLNTRVASELQRGSEPAVFGYVNNPGSSALSVLRRVDLVTATTPLFILKFDSDLTLDGITRLEILMHVRGMNLNQPKSLFRQ